MEREAMFVPALVTSLRTYTRRQFFADLTAGAVVGIVALPLAMAFAIASGVPPERGLYTAIVAGFLISALGGSRVQIGGPTGAFVVIVFDIVQRHGLGGLTICTLMAGVILLILGVARLGGAIKYIPYPVIAGFTSGIAVLIFSSQIKDLLGLTTGPLPGDFIGKWAEYARHLDTFRLGAVGLSLLSIATIVYWPRRWRYFPGSVAAMLLATVLAHLLGLDVETIGSRFGGIPATLPRFQWPDLSLTEVRDLVGPATTVALLAAIESLLSAVVADGMTGHRHRSNMELVAQGVANLCSPLFGGIPATGAIARTATNIKNGASTPVAGIVHSLTLLAIMLLFGRWASLVPMCALASVLVVVAYNMSEWRTFRSLLSTPRSDVAVLLTTFGLTVVFDLTLAVQVGMVLAAFLFMKRMADVTRVATVSTEQIDPAYQSTSADAASISKSQIPRGVQVYEVTGPFFFGAADKLRDVLNDIHRPPRVLILRMRHVPVIDATGLHTLEQVHKNCARSGTTLILCGVHDQPLEALQKSQCLDAIGRNNVTGNIDEALARSRELLVLSGEQLALARRHSRRRHPGEAA
jgi:SulP family sulfate permease